MGIVDTPRTNADQARSRSFAALFKELATTSAELLRAELRVARVEAGQVATHTARGVAQIALGAVLLLLGGLACATALVLLAGDQWLPDDRYWLAALVILVVTGALALWLARRGMSRLHPSRLAPGETIETLKEDKEWLKQRLTSGGTSSARASG